MPFNNNKLFQEVGRTIMRAALDQAGKQITTFQFTKDTILPAIKLLQSVEDKYELIQFTGPDFSLFGFQGSKDNDGMVLAVPMKDGYELHTSVAYDDFMKMVVDEFKGHNADMVTMKVYGNPVR